MLPFTIIAQTSKASTILMGLFDSFQVLFIIDLSLLGVGNKESIVSISGGVGLRLEKGIEVPETALDVAICLHFFKAHF